MVKPMSAEALRAEQGVEDHDWRDKLPKRLVSLLSDDEMVYAGRIIDLARTPMGAESSSSSSRISKRRTWCRGATFTRASGRSSASPTCASIAAKFQGWNHLNHAGAMIASDRVAAAIAPLL